MTSFQSWNMASSIFVLKSSLYLEIDFSFKEKTSAPDLATCVQIGILPGFLYRLLLHRTTVGTNTISNSQACSQDFDWGGAAAATATAYDKTPYEGEGGEEAPASKMEDFRRGSLLSPGYMPANSAVSL